MFAHHSNDKRLELPSPIKIVSLAGYLYARSFTLDADSDVLSHSDSRGQFLPHLSPSSLIFSRTLAMLHLVQPQKCHFVNHLYGYLGTRFSNFIAL